MDIAVIIAGLLLLFVGGEGLVRGAVSIAGRLRLSTLLVSTVIIGFGTSMPELLVSLQAAMAGTPDIALGNVVGSNIANILLILGIVGVMAGVECRGTAIRRDAVAGVSAAILLCGASFLHRLSWPAGLVMVGALAAYIAYSYFTERRQNHESAELRQHIEAEKSLNDGMGRALLFTVAGLAVLLVGARLLVSGAVSLAQSWGISEAVIGLTLVAVGTSLPELATAVIAALRKHADIVIGNILGSNLFNILGILGVTALVVPVPFAGRIADIDVWIMLGVSVMLAALILLRGRIGRGTGISFLALYTAYNAWLFTTG